MGAAIMKIEYCAGRDVFDRAGNNHLSWASKSDHARAYVHRYARYSAFAKFALTGVQARANIDPNVFNHCAYRQRTACRLGRIFEESEEIVSKSVDLDAVELLELTSSQLVGEAGRSFPFALDG